MLMKLQNKKINKIQTSENIRIRTVVNANLGNKVTIIGVKCILNTTA